MSNTETTDKTLDYYKEFKTKLVTFLAEELEIPSTTALGKSQSLFKVGVVASAACAGFDLGLSHENTLALMISIEGLRQRHEARRSMSEWFFSNQGRENRHSMEKLIVATVPLIEKLPQEHKNNFQKRFTQIHTTFA